MGSMTEDELLNVVESYIANSSLTRTSELDEDVADALDYYYGKPFGNEIEGRSSVVTRDVLEAVEWALPSIVRVFASGDRFVEFDPVGPEDVELADQETQYINHLIIKKNNGWKMFYDWFKGAMLQKNAYVKSWVDEKETITTTEHENLTSDQLIELRSQEGAVVTDLQEVVSEEFGVLYNATIEVSKICKSIKTECIPPEEMRIWNDWGSLSLDGCPFISHEREVSVSDLVAMGFDEDEIRMAANNEESGTYRNQTEQARNRYQQSGDDETEDDSQERVLVSECYVLVDFNGDGLSELRKVFKIGSGIFENKEIDDQPFSTISPMPMPHQHIGMSYAELAMDIQLIKSTLIRQMLDNLYLTNNPEKEVVESMVNMEDLMISVPGGIKRVQMPNSIREISVPFTAGQSIPMLTILDHMKETRIGISRGSMGLDADVLAKSTRGAFLGALESASQRIEMVSRVFAETGVRELFLKVHKLAITHMDKEEVIKIRGKYVPVLPTEWRDRYNTTVVVGLGSGNRDEQLQQLMVVAEKQEQHMLNGSPLVTLSHLEHTYSKILNLIGFKDTTNFFADPDSPEFQQRLQQMAQRPKEPSDIDKTLAAQKEIEALKAKLKAAEAQGKQKFEMAKFSKEMQLKYDNLKFDYDQLMSQMQQKMTELELEYDENVPGSKV